MRAFSAVARARETSSLNTGARSASFGVALFVRGWAFRRNPARRFAAGGARATRTLARDRRARTSVVVVAQRVRVASSRSKRAIVEARTPASRGTRRENHRRAWREVKRNPPPPRRRRRKPPRGGATKYEDMFEVIDRDPDGKKFDRVSRYKCRSEFDAELTLDVNVDVYPLTVGQRFSLALAPTLSLDGTPEDDAFDQSGKPSLADGYEYVMYGKCYKKVDENAGGLTRASAYISFGGLLMNLKAESEEFAGD